MLKTRAAPQTERPPPFGPTLALTIAAALAAFAALAALVLLATHPAPLPAPLPGSQNQDVESALFAIAFVVIVPAATIWVPRITGSIARGPNGAGLSLLASSLSALLALALCAARLVGGQVVLLGVSGAWLILAAFAAHRAAGSKPWSPALRGTPTLRVMWAVAAGSVVADVFAFAPLSSVTPTAFVVSFGLGLAGVLAYSKLELLRISAGPWSRVVDVLFLLLLLVAIPNLLIFNPEAAPGNLGLAIQTGVIQFHHNFLLGPTNQVLGGDAVLVHTASQYGVGSIYFLAGWFQFVPIGYGTLGFLDGILTALTFVVSYFVLRIAGTPRSLAIVALVVGVIAVIYNRTYTVGAIPQDGPLRFGLPILIVPLLCAASRWPGRRKLFRAGAFIVLGLSAVWSFEAFSVTVVTLGALLILELWMTPSSERVRLARGDVLAAGIACIGAHLLLAGITLDRAGTLPDWGQYLAFLHAFLAGGLGNITYDIAAWSPGLAVGAAYGASVAGIILTARLNRRLILSEQTLFIAVTGMTFYGIAIFNYFVDRSAGHILVDVALPVIVVVTLWLGLLLREATPVGAPVRNTTVVMAVSVAALTVSIGWSGVTANLPDTALAEGLPGGRSLRDAMHRLWNPPPLDGRAPEGQQILEKDFPGRHAIVLVSPELSVEILMRAGKANDLPIGDPVEDGFASSGRLPDLANAIDNLKGGERLLTDRPALNTLPGLLAHPDADLFTNVTASGELAPIQSWAIREIGKRFRIEPVKETPGGYIIARLVPRTPD